MSEPILTGDVVWQTVEESDGQTVEPGALIIGCHMLNSVSNNDVKCAVSLAPLMDLVDIMKASNWYVLFSSYCIQSSVLLITHTDLAAVSIWIFFWNIKNAGNTVATVDISVLCCVLLSTFLADRTKYGRAYATMLPLSSVWNVLLLNGAS